MYWRRNVPGSVREAPAPGEAGHRQGRRRARPEARQDHLPLPLGKGWMTTSRYPNRMAHSSAL